MEEIQYFPQWMLKNIQVKLIHILGGYTYEDINKNLKNTYNKGINDGQRKAFLILHDKISSLYGLSKQEWIDNVWHMINHVRFFNNNKNTRI